MVRGLRYPGRPLADVRAAGVYATGRAVKAGGRRESGEAGRVEARYGPFSVNRGNRHGICF